MQRVQRGFGRLKPKGTDFSQVATFMKDYDEAGNMLKKLIDNTKQWRDAWSGILTSQFHMGSELFTLYNPIVGAGDSYEGHVAVETSEEKIARVQNLAVSFEELKVDLMAEVNLVDERIIRPSMDAQASLGTLKKTMKKREDRKSDYEKAERRVDDLRKKMKRSDRDNANLEKYERDLERAKEDFTAIEEHIRDSLPTLVTTVFTLLPLLLNNLIMIQNNLLAHYYTTLHNYCQDEGFSEPAPPSNEIIAAWEADFRPIQMEMETQFDMIAKGKTVKKPMRLEDGSRSTTSLVSSRNLSRRGSSMSAYSIKAPPPPPPLASPAPMRSLTAPASASSTSLARIPSTTSTHSYQTEPMSPSSAYLSPVSTHSGLATHSPAAPNADYFTRDRPLHSNGSSLSSQSLAAMAVGKKKPPPPPPPRKLSPGGRFVTALYAFAGEAAGDLSFKEGDRIRVIKSTASMDDWWEGEIGGVKGAFPANYCSPG